MIIAVFSSFKIRSPHLLHPFFVTVRDLTTSHNASCSVDLLNKTRANRSGGVLLQGQNVQSWLHWNVKTVLKQVFFLY